MRKWRMKNKEKANTLLREWIQKNYEKHRTRANFYQQIQRDDIAEVYILRAINQGSTIRLHKGELPPEFLELYRLNLQLKREKRKWTSKQLTTSE